MFVDHTYARRRARYLVPFPLGDAKLKAGLSRRAGVQAKMFGVRDAGVHGRGVGGVTCESGDSVDQTRAPRGSRSSARSTSDPGTVHGEHSNTKMLYARLKTIF